MSAQAPPLVSIIVPCYAASAKQAELLDETLHTVAGQTCRDYEIIVVDDGSPFDIKEVTGRHPQTMTLRQANAGSAVARNTGIAASRGRYMVFLDADDHLLPPALEAGLQAFAERPECGFVIGRREEMTYEGDPVPWGVAARPVVQGDAAAEAAFQRGLAQLTDIFRDCLRENVEDRMRAGEWRRALRAALLLARESPRRALAATARGLRTKTGTGAV